MGAHLIVNSAESPASIFERHFSLRCPSCGVSSNLSAVSLPRYEFLCRFRPDRVGIVYRCDACNAPVFLAFDVESYDTGNSRVLIADEFEQIQRPSEKFELEHLPPKLAADFSEALTCYSAGCWNAFAAMCRRTVQAAGDALGAKGTSRVEAQLKELRTMAVLDDEAFDQLKQLILAGHDGAHPNLPTLSEPRARILLELMKDVLYQLFVRQAKIRKAAELRAEAVKGDA